MFVFKQLFTFLKRAVPFLSQILNYPKVSAMMKKVIKEPLESLQKFCDVIENFNSLIFLLVPNFFEVSGSQRLPNVAPFPHRENCIDIGHRSIEA